MPTILFINGFRFFFFSGDRNEPPHIHVKKGDGDGKIWLLPEVRVEYLVAFKKQEESEIIEIVKEDQERSTEKWYEYFGK